MSRNVDLWQYLPPFLQDFYEMNGLLAAEQPEFQQLADRMDQLLNDLFISTATDEGLQRFEALIGIKPAADATIKQRRTNVKARWYDPTAFTIRALIERLKILQGDNNVDAWVPAGTYLLHVLTDLSTADEIASAQAIIDSMIPANLGRQFDFEDIIEGVTAYYGMAALYSGTTGLNVEDDTSDYTWYLDEAEAVLTDENGIVLFE